MKSILKALDPFYPWQSWPRNYEPTVAELEAMSTEEYELWREEEERHNEMAEFRAAGRKAYHVYGWDEFIKSVGNHPSSRDVGHNNR